MTERVGLCRKRASGLPAQLQRRVPRTPTGAGARKVQTMAATRPSLAVGRLLRPAWACAGTPRGNLRFASTRPSEPDWELARTDRKAALNKWFDELHAGRAASASAISESERRRFQGLVHEKFMHARAQQRKSLNRIGAALATLVGESRVSRPSCRTRFVVGARTRDRCLIDNFLPGFAARSQRSRWHSQWATRPRPHSSVVWHSMARP